jgi:FlgN protein/Flagella basal body rod protein
VINPMLEAELLSHLDHQLRSAQRLLGLVLAQGEAIRARDSERVLAKLGEIQSEMGRCGRLEQERTRLLQSGGALLGLPAQHVTQERLRDLITPAGARAARERSSELRGLLGEIAREHGINRALMRLELAFLSHLVAARRRRAGGRLPARRRARRGAGRRPAAPDPRPPRLMPISSFYGLQTSLRGLLAQQRALDTTGHNIANASTAGYSRQEAVMAASDALVIPQGAVQGGAGAHIGSGVDVLSYRRVRDNFLDLQYRAQATRLGEEAGCAEGLGRAELALSEPGDNGINKQLSDFWSAWADLANAPDDPAARTALLEQADALAEAFGIVDAQLELVGQQSADEYAALTAPGGEIDQIGQEIAALNDTIKRFVTAGDTPSDLMDRRDLLLDKLAGDHVGRDQRRRQRGRDVRRRGRARRSCWATTSSST